MNLKNTMLATAGLATIALATSGCCGTASVSGCAVSPAPVYSNCQPQCYNPCVDPCADPCASGNQSAQEYVVPANQATIGQPTIAPQ